MTEYGIAAFRSRQQVLRFEEALKREGMNVRVISTPRDVAIGCGLSVQFSAGEVRRVQSVLARMRPSNLIGVYLVEAAENGRTRLRVVSKQG